MWSLFVLASFDKYKYFSYLILGNIYLITFKWTDFSPSICEDISGYSKISINNYTLNHTIIGYIGVSNV